MSTAPRSSSSYREINASAYIWDSLWRSDQNSFVKLNILDAIQIVAGDIVRWLFTSSEGYVKSKSKNRWNTDSLAERCVGNNSDGHFRANISETLASSEWNAITCYQDLESLLIKDGNLNHNNSKPAIVSFGHTYGNVSYLETIYEIVDGLPFPKFKTFSMCGSKAMGTLYQTDKTTSSIPSEKIKCLNKTINAATQKFVTDLVRIVESRRNVQILKIVVILMSESDDSSDMENEKTLWMHHIKDLVITTKKLRININSEDTVSQLDSKSEWTQKRSYQSSAEVSHNTSSFQRKGKCTGDFCRYSDKEEIRYIESFGEDDSNAIIEGRRAVSRHRPNSSNDTEMFSPVDLEIVPFQVKDTGDESPWNHADAFDCELPLFSQSHFVPHKSIALARQDMAELETQERNNSIVEKLWPQRLLHWWWRVGQTVVPRRLENMVGCSQNAFSKTSIESLNGTKGYVKEQSPLNSKGDGESVGFSRDDESTIGNQTHVSSVSHVPYDLTINAFEGKRRRNLGEVNSYYSDAKVCERCYSVYRDIDYKRRLYKNKQFASLRDSSLDIHAAEERSKEIEKKRFSQRKFASRMSTVQLRKEEGDRNENKYTTHEKSYSDSANDLLYGGDSMAFNSVCGSPSPERRFGQRSPKKRAIAVGSQKGKLPPLGQLRDGEKVQTYQQVGSSFLRNIGSNSQHYKISSNYQRESGSVKENASSHAETEHQWEQVTRGAARRIQSEGDMLRKNKKITNDSGMQIKVFDSNKLLHGHQRELYSMRAAATSETSGTRVNTGAGVRIMMAKKERKRLNPKEMTSDSPLHHRQLPPLGTTHHKNTENDAFNQYQAAQESRLSEVRRTSENSLLSTKSSLREASGNARLNDQFIERKNVTFSEKSQIDQESDPSLSSTTRPPYIEKKEIPKANASERDQGNTDKADDILHTSFVRTGGNSVNVSDYLAGLYDRANDDSGSDSDDNDGEEEGIGWSPFVIPVGN